MKLYEIEHINNPYNKNAIMGMELKFIYSICSSSGKLWKAEKQPDDWDHVKRLTHMLFLAWDDKNPMEGVVYLGEFVSVKTDKEYFYEFFKKFNGFPINEMQKKLFDNVNSKYNMGTRGRQGGVSTFLMTLSAWEANKGNKVIWAHTNKNILTRFEREYHNKCVFIGIDPTPIDCLVADDSSYSNLLGRSYDIGLYDCSSNDWQLDWWKECDYRCSKYSMALRTTEL